MIHIAIGILIFSLTLAVLAIVAFVQQGAASVSGSYLTATGIALAASIALVWLVRHDGL